MHGRGPPWHRYDRLNLATCAVDALSSAAGLAAGGQRWPPDGCAVSSGPEAVPWRSPEHLMSRGLTAFMIRMALRTTPQ
jgi:hypothetical protein